VDLVDEIIQAELILKIFNMPEWSAVVKLEEEIKKDTEKRLLTMSPQKPMDEYYREQLYYKGRRDAIALIWSKRHELIQRLKHKEKQDG